MKHQNTIGRFYKYILNELGNLTDCGKNDSIFTGDPTLQVEFGKYSPLNQSTKVTDFSTAVDAIRRIVNEVKVVHLVTLLPGALMVQDSCLTTSSSIPLLNTTSLKLWIQKSRQTNIMANVC